MWLVLFLVLIWDIKSDDRCTEPDILETKDVFISIMDSLEEMVELQKSTYMDPMKIQLKENSCSISRRCGVYPPCSVTCGIDSEPYCDCSEGRDYDGYPTHDLICECRLYKDTNDVIERAVSMYCIEDIADHDFSMQETRAIERFCRKWVR